MEISNEELITTQNVLEKLIKKELDSPMSNYTKIGRLVEFTKEIDTLRRESWNNEKFGEYDNTAILSYDDIPF